MTPLVAYTQAQVIIAIMFCLLLVAIVVACLYLMAWSLNNIDWSWLRANKDVRCPWCNGTIGEHEYRSGSGELDWRCRDERD